MNIVRRIAALAVAVVVVGAGWAGCNKASMPASGATGAATTAAAPVATSISLSIPTNAQPRLKTIKLWLGPEEMITELALSFRERQTGMMFRTNMAENEGMLFVFPSPERVAFWMMNTSVPLSAAYLDPEGVILEIHKLEPHNTNSVEAASDRIQYVLETPQGWFDRHNVRTGAVVRSEYGPLKSTFTQRRSGQ